VCENLQASWLPDGFSGECEPLSKTQSVLGGEMSGWVTKTKKDTHLSVLRFLGKREFRAEREYSHAQPLVSELPDGFSGECEPERLRCIANAMPIP
jgi:hypothetical protein